MNVGVCRAIDIYNDPTKFQTDRPNRLGGVEGTDGRTDGLTDGRTDGRTDRQSTFGPNGVRASAKQKYPFAVKMKAETSSLQKVHLRFKILNLKWPKYVYFDSVSRANLADRNYGRTSFVKRRSSFTH